MHAERPSRVDWSLLQRNIDEARVLADKAESVRRQHAALRLSVAAACAERRALCNQLMQSQQRMRGALSDARAALVDARSWLQAWPGRR